MGPAEFEVQVERDVQSSSLRYHKLTALVTPIRPVVWYHYLIMPLAQSWLDLEKASGGRAVLKGTPDEIKAMHNGLVESLLPHLPKPSENVESKDGDVDGIGYRLYWPKSASSALPTAIWGEYIQKLMFCIWW